MPTTLSDTHRVILANAAAQDSLRALPIPSTISVDADTIAKVLAELVEDELLAETSNEASPLWNGDGDGYTNLRITSRGLLAIGVTPPGAEDSLHPELDWIDPTAIAPGTKLHQIVTLLQRPEGAVIDEMVLATGWQKHSVRGAMSGPLKKKHKHQISSAVIEGRGRVYRIEPFVPGTDTVPMDALSGAAGDEAHS